MFLGKCKCFIVWHNLTPFYLYCLGTCKCFIVWQNLTLFYLYFLNSRQLQIFYQLNTIWSRSTYIVVYILLQVHERSYMPSFVGFLVVVCKAINLKLSFLSWPALQSLFFKHSWQNGGKMGIEKIIGNSFCIVLSCFFYESYYIPIPYIDSVGWRVNCIKLNIPII